jgi:hypothetical protein
VGVRDGSIIATIMTTHIARNEAPAVSQVWPGIIHAVNRVPPYDTGMLPDIVPDQ